MPAHFLRRAAAGSLACALISAGFGTAAPTAESRAYAFAYDGVLGTSLDLTFVAPSADVAAAAERATLDELARVSGVINTYDEHSEISRLVQRGRIEHASSDLIDVLRAYDMWHERSAGVFTARAGEITAVWRAAERLGRVPADSTLARIARSIAMPAWRVDSNSVITLADGAKSLDVNSLGKGYALDRAIEAVQRAVPSLRGGMINIGGDIRVWGEAPTSDAKAWRVGVVNPTAHADNALPLTRVALVAGAVSSSGNYARGFDIAHRHYSHIIDPRTGLPADSVVGVTIVARDNATANALATSLSVLTPVEGMRLINSVSNAEAILITADGMTLRSPGFAALEVRDTSVPPTRAVARAGLHAKVSVDVTPTEYNRHRPYVAVWVTDSAGKLVRTLAQLGDKWKYIPELSQWYALARSSRGGVDAVSRATRPAGEYTFEWDGRDEAGAAALPGSYTFWLEAAYEHGAHSVKSVKLDCRGAVASGPFATAAAFKGGKAECSVER